MKMISVFLIISTFSMCLTVFQFYETLDCQNTAKLISAFQKFFQTGCVSILHDRFSDFSNLSLFKTLWKTVPVFDSYITLAEYGTFNYRTHCERNRPLYVVFSNEKQELYYVFQKLNTTNARWLLFLQNNSSLEEIFYQIDIPIDIELFVAQIQEDTVFFNEVFRVHPTFPLEIHKVGNWSYSLGIQWTLTSFFKRRNNLRGLQFSATFTQFEPVTEVNLLNDGNYSVNGYFGDIWSALEKKLNFTTKFAEPEDEWGNLINNSWSGMIGKIVEGTADVGVAAFSITTQRLSYVDFLVPLVTSRDMLHIRKPEITKPNWSSFFMPFNFNLWICIIAAIFLLATALALTSYFEHRHGAPEPRPYSLSDSFLCIFGSFCSQGQDSTPKTWTCRFVYVLSFLLGMVFLAAYSASLVSFLTSQRPELPFYNLKGLLSDGTYKFFVVRGSLLEYFRTSADVNLRLVYEKQILASGSLLRQVKQICEDPKYALMASSYAVKGLQKRENLNCTILSLPRTVMIDILSMVLKKNSPYTRILSHSLQEMKYNGELQRIRQFHMEDDKQVGENEVPELNMLTMSPVFTILGFGILISLIFLLGEIMKRHLAEGNGEVCCNFNPDIQCKVLTDLQKLKRKRTSL